jgi:seryl-tRNA synthetase
MFADEPAEEPKKGLVQTIRSSSDELFFAFVAEPEKVKGEFDDIFEEDEDATEEEKAAAKARQARMEQARKLKEEKDAKEGKKKKDKPKAVEKSLCVLEVKPWEADTDLKMVWEKIREYKQEGLTWGETYKLEPVAFGIMKLVMTCTIVDR